MPIKLKLTHHFQARQIERGLEIDHIKKAIADPDEKEDVSEEKFRVRKKIGDKKIEVIYCKDGFKDTRNTYLVITAYYIEL